MPSQRSEASLIVMSPGLECVLHQKVCCMAVEGLREASSKRLEMLLQLHRVCLMMLGIATVFGGDLHYMEDPFLRIC